MDDPTGRVSQGSVVGIAVGVNTRPSVMCKLISLTGTGAGAIDEVKNYRGSLKNWADFGRQSIDLALNSLAGL